MLGAVLGGLVVAVIYNGLCLLSLSAATQYIWTALVLLAGATVDSLARRAHRAAASGKTPRRGRRDPLTGARRPTRAELDAARDRTIPDVAAPGLRVLFAGINPGLYSAATGHHFARPGNRFWPALHDSGFTDRVFRPDEQQQLLPLGLGITNVVDRATARADELTPAEIRVGGRALAVKVARLAPRWLAVVGVTVYRTAFDRPGATIGRQKEKLAGAGLWVLPNPSGLNAHYSAAALAAEFARLRKATETSPGTGPGKRLM
jgi:TDG/mug DNA glycosylase family protein